MKKGMAAVSFNQTNESDKNCCIKGVSRLLRWVTDRVFYLWEISEESLFILGGHSYAVV